MIWRAAKYHKSCFQLITALGISIGLSACTTVNQKDLNPTDIELQTVMTGAALMLEGQNNWQVPNEPLINISDEMRHFLDAHIPQKGSRQIKFRTLLNVMADPEILNLRYNISANFTAIESFQQQQANCLSFSALFITLARELGLKANFNEVEVPPSWNMLGDNTFVLYKHINIVVKQYPINQVIDFGLPGYRSHYQQKVISDDIAQAHYYNNKGMALLVEGTPQSAFPYLQQALKLAPNVDHLWNNMGAIYRRAGFLSEAKTAYLQALRLNPRHQQSLSNLARLYQQEGDHKQAEFYANKVKRSRLANPYYRFQLAQRAFDKGNLNLALEHIQKSISKKPKEHRFYVLAADIYEAMGLANKAKSSREQASQFGQI